jgi:hypothetical protein
MEKETKKIVTHTVKDILRVTGILPREAADVALLGALVRHAFKHGYDLEEVCGAIATVYQRYAETRRYV